MDNTYSGSGGIAKGGDTVASGGLLELFSGTLNQSLTLQGRDLLDFQLQTMEDPAVMQAVDLLEIQVLLLKNWGLQESRG